MARTRVFLRNVVWVVVLALLVKVLVLCGLPALAGIVIVVGLTFGFAVIRLGAIADKQTHESLQNNLGGDDGHD